MKVAAVNVSFGLWYPKGQQRLRDSTEGLFDGTFMGFSSEQEVGSHPHKSVPYAFKPCALQKARSQGFDVVMWMDAACWFVRPSEPLIRDIVEHGHLFYSTGCAGEWTSDLCLDFFKITRDDAMRVTMPTACFFGLDLRRPECVSLLDEWQYLSLNHTELFKGSWTNEFRQVSSDLRCHGHRHDQSVLTFLILKHGLSICCPTLPGDYSVLTAGIKNRYRIITDGRSLFQYKTKSNSEHAVVLAQGM